MSYFPCSRCGCFTGMINITYYPCACTHLDFLLLLHARAMRMIVRSRKVQEGTTIEPLIADPLHESYSAITAGAPKPPPRFKIGDRVRVVRLIPEASDFTSRELLKLEGTIMEVDDIVVGSTRLQVNYDVDGHYMHEEELEPA